MADAQDDAELDRLTDAFVARLRAGELPDIEAYAAEHPAHAERLRDLLPVLVAMEAARAPTLPEVPRAAAKLPEYVGRFRVVRELGRGGMGRVFEARDDSGARVAVKVVHPHLVDRPGYLARFLREVDTGGLIDHPGVVRTLGSGVADDLGDEAPYLVLEFVEGQNLRELLAEVSPLSERLCRVIGARVARALDAVHAAGVVHRDVKPENVVITPDETVKLMDLGVALIQEEGQRLSQTGEFVGSLLYSAPEQLRGGRIGPATDLYALGLVLFELLTGRHAGAEPGRARPVIASAPRDDVSVRAHAPHVSPFMDALVRWLLQPQAERRPESARLVADVLQAGESSAWWQEQGAGTPAAVDRRAALRPLVGRTRELEHLEGLLPVLATGKGRTCVLVGEPGIGTSHLLQTWLARVASSSQAPRILELDHAAVAGGPVAGSLAGALDAAFGDELRATVSRLLADDAGLADAVVDYLRGVEGGDVLSADAAENANLLLLRELAREHGLILAIENLHMASADRLAAFLRLVRATAEAPILIVGTARAPVDAQLARELDRLEHGEQLVLGPLEESESLELLTSLVGAATSASRLRALVRRSGGNPYFLRELARAYDRQATSGPEGSESGIPDSLDALIHERLAALEPGMLELLGAAACFEHAFDPDVVVTAVELPRIAGLRMLHALDRTHGLLAADGSLYRFRQQLVREKLHDDLPPALRAAYHTAIATVLEGRLGEGDAHAPDVARRIARHHLLGERPAGAIPYARRALDELTGRHEQGAVIAMAERLRAFDAELPSDLGAHVAYALGVALLADGTLEGAREALGEARALFEAGGHAREALRAVMALSDGVRSAGRFDEARALAEQAVAEALALGDVSLVAQAYDRLSLILRDLGEAQASQDAATRGLEAASEAGDTAAIGRLSTTLGSLAVEQGRMEEAGLLLDRGVSIASLVGDRLVESSALTALAKIAFFEGRLATALPLLGRVLHIAYEQGNTRLEGVTATNMALVMPSTGDFEEARRLAERARSVGSAFGYPELVAHALMTIGQVHVDQGAYGKGLARFEEAAALLETMGTPTMEARLNLVHPNALAWVGRFDEAAALFERGLDAARNSCTPREVHMIEWAAALMLEARGDAEAAFEAATKANAALRATGAELMAVQNDQRLAEFHVRRGEHAAARPLLENALATAERGGLRGLAALCRAWSSLLEGGNPVRARQELEVHAGVLTAHARLRALAALAERMPGGEVRAEARALAERIVASVPAEQRAATIDAVALYRGLLGGG